MVHLFLDPALVSLCQLTEHNTDHIPFIDLRPISGPLTRWLSCSHRFSPNRRLVH
jgi:hypothetical protein